MKNIGIDQPLSNSALFEHRCLQSINKLYKHDGKCENQKQFKDILEATMVFTPEGFADNSTRSTMTPPIIKKPSYRILLCIITNIVHVKKKTSICKVGAAK